MRKRYQISKAIYISTIAISAILTLAFILFNVLGGLKLIPALTEFYTGIRVMIIALAFAFLSVVNVIVIATRSRIIRELKYRNDDIERIYKVKKTYFANQRTFLKYVSPLVKKNASEFKLYNNYLNALKTIREKNSDPFIKKKLPEPKLIVKPKQGAFISFKIFSSTVNYQYYQLEKMDLFYGYIIKYLNGLLEKKENLIKLHAGFEDNTFFIYYIGEDKKEIDIFIDELERSIYELFEKSNTRVNMHPSFGIYPIDGKTNDVYAMFINCSLALNRAINNYQNRLYYDERLLDEVVHDDVLEQEIREGIKNHDFKVYYQAKFDIQTNKFVGAEALIRWQHPTRGLFSPGAFIGECEKSGLIHILDFYVFEQVCKDLGDWRKRGRRMIPISVNFTSSDFNRPDFVESISNELVNNKVPASYLEVEITESSTASNFVYVFNILEQLKELHVRILMDDFGTGFSSLGNLAKYPISALKIDKSFIDAMTSDLKNREIVRMIINLAKSLNIESIAEGVQTQEQVDILKEMRCNVIQGFYYSKPLSKQEFEVFLATNTFERRD